VASVELIKALAATAELCGRTYTEEAARMLAYDLEGYDEHAVMRALSRCRKELKPGQFCVEAIISRLDDGRPGPEEAWAMLPHDEYKTVVWTEEMSGAWGVAYPLLNEGETVAARMAFKESYNRLVTEAREKRVPAKWTASLGHDKAGRDVVLLEAMQRGRLTANQVQGLLPYHEVSPQAQALIDNAKRLMLEVA
jgi:hypothetical protein